MGVVGEVPRGLRCPRCGAGLEPTGEPAPIGGLLFRCARCDEFFRARRRESRGDDPPEDEAVAVPRRPVEPKPVGGLSLRLRSAAIRTLARVYPIGVATGATVMLPLGGFVPVLKGWLRDEVEDWGGVVEALGGVRVVPEIRDPDADLGPVLVRLDAPTLFQEVAAVARRLGVKPPDQIRLAYLPCCGVVGWRKTRILLLGLPLLQVLTQAELRAVLAHELAHLARGDVALSAGASRFVQSLGRAIDRNESRLHGPLGRVGESSPWRRWPAWLEAPDRPRPGSPRRPELRGRRRGRRRGLGIGQGRDGPAPLPRGPRSPRPRPRRPPQHLRLLPDLLATPPQRGPRGDAPRPPRQRDPPLRLPPPGPPRPPRRLPDLPLSDRTPGRPLLRLDPDRRPRSLRATPP